MITQFVLATLTAYTVTFCVASSSLLSYPRACIIHKLPWLQPTGHKHFIECRMCVGFWASLAVCFFLHILPLTLAVYGASYFMATQER